MLRRGVVNGVPQAHGLVVASGGEQQLTAGRGAERQRTQVADVQMVVALPWIGYDDEHRHLATPNRPLSAGHSTS